MANIILKKFKHPVREYVLDRNGKRDIDQLLGKIPPMSALRAGMLIHSESLEALNNHYNKHVSLDYMAASLESSALLLSLADIIQPKIMVDLGSGFSSYVLRKYASSLPQPPQVYSVDINAEWLQKIAKFLVEHNLDALNLMVWHDMQQRVDLRFDLILHDLGDMSVRASALPWVLEHLNPDGFAILDDAHKSVYRRSVENTVAAAGMELYSLRDLTYDQLGRFAMLVHKPVISPL